MQDRRHEDLKRTGNQGKRREIKLALKLLVKDKLTRFGKGPERSVRIFDWRKGDTMTVTEISSRSNIQDTASSGIRQISGANVRDAFTDLARALQSGDLQAAQQAFATIQSGRRD